MKAMLPPLNVAPGVHQELVALTRACLAACRSRAKDGTVLFRPDATGGEDAMWTRDLCYLLEGAGALMDPREMLAAIDYLLAGQREDGAVPDRRGADGVPVYAAGPADTPLGRECPTDNPAFMVKLVAAYVRTTGDIRAFLDRRDALYRAVDTVPLSPDALVCVDRNRPHTEYGFTDRIAKTGNVFFSTMLYWEACQTLAKLCARAEYHDEAHDWYERAEPTSHRIGDFWDEDWGLFWAASEWCHQPDLWGSAYACVVRVATKTQARRIAEYFLGAGADCVLHGHLRHLPAGQYWHRTLRDVPRDTHQNGGFWSIPSGWLAQTVFLVDPPAAIRLIDDVLAQFLAHGVNEWISPSGGQVPGHVASVANVLGAVQPSKKLARPSER